MDGDTPTLPQGQTRGLTPGERAMARDIFGAGVNYDEVRVQNGKDGLGWDVANILGSFFGADATSTRPQVVGNTIYFPKGQYKDDFSAQDSDDHTFIHEMTHIWQGQNNMLSTAAKSATDVVTHGLKYDETYAFKLDPAKDLRDYNLEQQAEIVADYHSWRKQQVHPEKEENLADDPSGTKYLANVSKFLQDMPKESPWRQMMLNNAAVDFGADGSMHLNPQKYAGLIEAQKQSREEDKRDDAARLKVMDNFLRDPHYLNPVQGVTKDIVDLTVGAVPAALDAIWKFKM